MSGRDPAIDFEISQEFYGERYFVGHKELHETGYSDYVDGEGIRRLIEITLQHFSPKRVLDVGCARGYTVHRLMRAGLFAVGVDYSEYAVLTSPREARPFVMQGDALALPFADETFDLIICIETLEHLWPSQVPQAIAELARVTSDWVFLSIPSFGFNDFGPCAMPIITPSHVEDAKANRPFRELSIDPKGLPHHGHLTAATYRWWTERLAEQGLHRVGWLERQINRNPLTDPKAWMFYAVRKAPLQVPNPLASTRISDSFVEMGNNDDLHLGTGWYDYDEHVGARWTTEEATAYCLSTARDAYVLFEFTYPPSLEGRLGAQVEICRRKPHHPETSEAPCTVQDLTLTPGKKWTQRRMPLPGETEESVIEIRFKVRHPWEDGNSPSRHTDRLTGICVRRILLSPRATAQWPLRYSARSLFHRWRRKVENNLHDLWNRAKGAPRYYSRFFVRRLREFLQRC